jgi:hypothetical protein
MRPHCSGPSQHCGRQRRVWGHGSIVGRVAQEHVLGRERLRGGRVCRWTGRPARLQEPTGTCVGVLAARVGGVSPRSACWGIRPHLMASQLVRSHATRKCSSAGPCWVRTAPRTAGPDWTGTPRRRVRIPPDGCRGPVALAYEAGVTEDRPHPPAELVPSLPGPSHVRPHRRCPRRALTIGRQRSPTDNHGRCPCPPTCSIGPYGAARAGFPSSR